jgi:hypothetical protein
MKKLLILVFCFIILIGCDNPFIKSSFGRGDQVIIKDTNEKGTINAITKRTKEYRVKLSDGSNKWFKNDEIIKDTGQKGELGNDRNNKKDSNTM